MEYNYKLFNAITDAIELLKDAQQAAEETVIAEKRVFFWRAPKTNRCGLIKEEDQETAVSALFDLLGEPAVELKCLSDGERFYESQKTF